MSTLSAAALAPAENNHLLHLREQTVSIEDAKEDVDWRFFAIRIWEETDITIYCPDIETMPESDVFLLKSLLRGIRVMLKHFGKKSKEVQRFLKGCIRNDSGIFIWGNAFNICKRMTHSNVLYGNPGSSKAQLHVLLDPRDVVENPELGPYSRLVRYFTEDMGIMQYWDWLKRE